MMRAAPKNTGTAYEALAEEVYRRYLRDERVTAEVQRNVQLQGKSGTVHQIDVTFVFRAAGIEYRTIVQCKDWASSVKQEQVLAFRAVLDDLPGQPRGVIIARTGFQCGAKNVAKHHGIKLYVLRAPDDEDWSGLIRRFVVTLRLAMPVFDDIGLVFDEEAIMAELVKRKIPSFQVEARGHFDFRDATDETRDLAELLAPYAVPDDHVQSEKRIRYRVSTPLFLCLPSQEINRLPILEIEANIRWLRHSEDLVIENNLIAYCFRDVLDGERRFLREDGEAVAHPSRVSEVQKSKDYKASTKT